MALDHATDETGLSGVIQLGLGDRAMQLESGISLTGVDHLVLTVRDVAASIDFYQRVLGMQPVTIGAGRHAVALGNQKINLHPAAPPIPPHAQHPTPGSGDLCLLTDLPIERVLAHLDTLGVQVQEGPVARTGARGPLLSVYIRDPDGNLIEIANEQPQVH